MLVGGTIALLYRYGPSRQPPPDQRIFPGAVLATLLWLIASAGLSFYVSHIAQPGRDLRPSRRRRRDHAVVLPDRLCGAARRRGERPTGTDRRGAGPASLLANETARLLPDGRRTHAERGNAANGPVGRRLRHRRGLYQQLLPRDHADLDRHDQPAARPSSAGPREAVHLCRSGLRQRLHHPGRRRQRARTRMSGGSTSIRRTSSSPTASPPAPA